MVRYEDNSLLGALPADGPIIPQGRVFPALRMEIQEDDLDFYPSFYGFTFQVMKYPSWLLETH